MNPQYQNIKGTFDILPAPDGRAGTHEASAAEWQHVEQVIRDILGRFNMEEIRTPVLEPTELIARGVGEETDIVTKEMFSFERSDTRYVLRPEVTAPVMRAYLQHHLDQQGGAQKVFYVGPCFRAERPQKGRYRQFHQFGCEVIGSSEPRADAEVIASMMAIYEAFGLRRTRLRLNTLGDAESRPRYRAALQEYFEPHKEKLSDTSRERLQKNPLRILDTKDPDERALLDEAPVLIDYVDDESRAHYDEVKNLLTMLDIDFEEDPLLVRGLDYYTRTTFELESPELGAQSALAGGGRYDLLAEALGSKQRVPAAGFAAGMERLFIALAAEDYAFPQKDAPDVFFVSIGEKAARFVMKQAGQLRSAGIRVSYDMLDHSVGKQFREADRREARYAVVIGEDELAAGRATVKAMATGEEEDVAFDQLEEFFQKNPHIPA